MAECLEREIGHTDKDEFDNKTDRERYTQQLNKKQAGATTASLWQLDAYTLPTVRGQPHSDCT